jgi:hypothetical protein
MPVAPPSSKRRDPIAVIFSLLGKQISSREREVRPTLSTVVLGQVWRGWPQAQLSRLLRGCRIQPLSEFEARSAGAALAASGRSDLVDAVVVVTALAREDLIVTSDPDDLRRRLCDRPRRRSARHPTIGAAGFLQVFCDAGGGLEPPTRGL